MPYLISCEGSKSILAYDPYSNVVLQTYAGSNSDSNCLVCNEGAIYAAQSKSSLIMIYKYSHNSPDFRSATAENVSSLAVYENILLAGHVDGSLSIWHLQSGQLIFRRENLQHSAILTLDVSNHVIALGTKSGSVVLYSLQEILNKKIHAISPLTIFAGNNQSIISVKIIAGSRVVSASQDGFIVVSQFSDFNTILSENRSRTAQMLQLRSVNIGGSCSAMTVSANDSLAFVGLTNGRIMPVRLIGPVANEGDYMTSFTSHHAGAVRSLCLTEDGSKLLSGDDSGEVFTWNVNSCQIAQKNQFNGPITNIVASWPHQVFSGSRLESNSLATEPRHFTLVYPLVPEVKPLQKYTNASFSADEWISDSSQIDAGNYLNRKLGLVSEHSMFDLSIAPVFENAPYASSENVMISREKLLQLEQAAALASAVLDQAHQLI